MEYHGKEVGDTKVRVIVLSYNTMLERIDTFKAVSLESASMNSVTQKKVTVESFLNEDFS